MPGLNHIVRTFFPFGETTEALMLAQGMKPITSTGEQLVGIGLMADIPDDFIIRCIKDIMQGNGEFHHPETGRKMAPGFGNGMNDFVP